MNLMSAMWKVSKYGVFCGPYLDTFHTLVISLQLDWKFDTTRVFSKQFRKFQNKYLQKKSYLLRCIFHHEFYGVDTIICPTPLNSRLETMITFEIIYRYFCTVFYDYQKWTTSKLTNTDFIKFEQKICLMLAKVTLQTKFYWVFKQKKNKKIEGLIKP